MRYRDRKTGRFVSKSTWKRSHARGGERYKRENPARYHRPPREEEEPEELPEPFEEPLEEEEEPEYAGAFDSPGGKKR
jgi:hypothetical protein